MFHGIRAMFHVQSATEANCRAAAPPSGVLAFLPREHGPAVINAIEGLLWGIAV